MKIIKQDSKIGLMEIIPETLDDLWHLSHIVLPGDSVSSLTTRRIQDTTGDRIRSDRGIKKTFFLGITVEAVNFHLFTGKLRLTGLITQGPEDLIPLGSHHTLEVKLNSPLKIIKDNWPKWILDRVNLAIEASKKLSAIIVSIEDDSALLGLLRQFGIEYYGPIHSGLSGKRIIDKNRGKIQRQYYDKIINSLLKFQDIQTIIIAGPGFVKNDFYDYLKEKDAKLSKKAIVESTGTGGRVGIHEILRKGIVEEITAEHRVASEMRSVNNLLEEIAKNSSNIAYGSKEVINAGNMGAIKELLILDINVAKKELENILNLAENMGAKVMVVSSEHDGGKQLEALGGVAAFLRYPIYK